MKPRARVYWDTVERKWCMSFHTPSSQGRSWFDLWCEACCAACLITRKEPAEACLRFWKNWKPTAIEARFDESAPFQSSYSTFDDVLEVVR